MENMDKELTVPKWVLINWPIIRQIPQNLSGQIVCPRQKVWDFDEKRLHWASAVRDIGALERIHMIEKHTRSEFQVDR